MNKIKESFQARCIAMLLAVISGIAIVAGAFAIHFTWSLELYQEPLNTVISDHARHMQAWYSARIFSEMEDISRANSKGSIIKSLQPIQTKLDNYPHTDNFEYGIIHADTLDHVDLLSRDSYIYENFKDTSPDHNSYCIYFVEGNAPGPESTPNLLNSLFSVYISSYKYYGTEPKPGSVYWIVSNVKKPVNEFSNDIFSRQKRLLTVMYNFRYTIILLTIFFAILLVLSAGFCCYSARGKNSPVTWQHKTPLILNLCFTLGITGICTFLFYKLLESMLVWHISFGLLCILFSLITAVAILAIVFLLMNLAVRQKVGILWKYTLTRALLLCICKVFRETYRSCLEHTPLLLKGIIIIVLFHFWELLQIATIFRDLKAPYQLWFTFRLIEVPLVFFILIQMKRLQDGSRRMADGDLETKIDTRHMFFEFRKHGKYLNQIGEGMSNALEERLKSEHFKTELITNVSHDIKTPLTSLINYVDLLQKENITEEERNEYLSVLERQAARLKKLIEDLIDASKAATGNLVVNMETCNIQILLTQVAGEFEEKLNASQLELVIREPDAPVTIQTDNRYLWRIFDNLMNNICKYAQPGTRVYIDLESDGNMTHITFRNISRYPLNFSGEELLERFVRGDVSRNTEGNGLGLSIARSLAESMKGNLDIYTDGDLFKVVVSFPLI